MNQTEDLFSAMGCNAALGEPAHYPLVPGHKGGDTSRTAADSIADSVPAMQAKVIAALRRAPMTSFELAAETGIDYGTIQPRTSELAHATDERPALIRDSGKRRTNPKTRRSAKVWELLP